MSRSITRVPRTGMAWKLNSCVAGGRRYCAALNIAILVGAATVAGDAAAQSGTPTIRVDWQRTLFDNRGDLRAESAVRLTDGSIALVGRFRNRNTSVTSGFVAVYESGGKLKKIKLFRHAGVSRCRRSAAYRDGGVIMLCSIKRGTQARRAALLYVHPLTGRIWSRSLIFSKIGPIQHTDPVFIATNARGGIFAGFTQTDQYGNNSYAVAMGFPQNFQQNNHRIGWRKATIGINLHTTGVMPTGERMILGRLRAPGDQRDRFPFFIITDRQGIWKTDQIIAGQMAANARYAAAIPVGNNRMLAVGGVRQNRQFRGIITEFAPGSSSRTFRQFYPFPGRGGAFTGILSLDATRKLITGSLVPKAGGSLAFAMLVWDNQQRRILYRRIVDTPRTDIASGSVRMGANSFVLFGSAIGGGDYARTRLISYTVNLAGASAAKKPDDVSKKTQKKPRQGENGGGPDAGLGKNGQKKKDTTAKPSGGPTVTPVWAVPYYKGRNELLRGVAVVKGKIFVTGRRYFDKQKGRTLTVLSADGKQENRETWPGVVGYDCKGPRVLRSQVVLICPPAGPDSKDPATRLRFFDFAGKSGMVVALRPPPGGYETSRPRAFVADTGDGAIAMVTWRKPGAQRDVLVRIFGSGEVNAKPMAKDATVDMYASAFMGRIFGGEIVNAFSDTKFANIPWSIAKQYFYEKGTLILRRLDMNTGKHSALATYEISGKALTVSAVLPVSKTDTVIAGAHMTPVTETDGLRAKAAKAAGKPHAIKQIETPVLQRLSLADGTVTVAWSISSTEITGRLGFQTLTGLVDAGGGRIVVFGGSAGKPKRFGLAILDAATGKLQSRLWFAKTSLRQVSSGVLDKDGSLIVGGGNMVARIRLP